MYANGEKKMSAGRSAASLSQEGVVIFNIHNKRKFSTACFCLMFFCLTFLYEKENNIDFFFVCFYVSNTLQVKFKFPGCITLHIDHENKN